MTDSIAQIYETLAPMKGQVNHDTVAFIRRANLALEKWWADCDELHRKHTLINIFTTYMVVHRKDGGSGIFTAQNTRWRTTLCQALGSLRGPPWSGMG